MKIISEEIYSPQSFLELITGQCYIIDCEPMKTINSVVEEVNRSLEEPIKHYYFTDIESIPADTNVVLVNVGSDIHYWYSIPSDIIEEAFEFADSIIFSVEEEKAIGKTRKVIHFLGYHYQSDGCTLYNHKFEEYNGFYAYLSTVLEHGFCNFEEENSEFQKQSTLDCTLPMIQELYNTYDNGHMPRIIKESDITKDITPGCYILKK